MRMTGERSEKSSCFECCCRTSYAAAPRTRGLWRAWPARAHVFFAASAARVCYIATAFAAGHGSPLAVPCTAAGQAPQQLLPAHTCTPFHPSAAPHPALFSSRPGCPNGCARPYMAELGFVGDGPNSYQVRAAGWMCELLTKCLLLIDRARARGAARGAGLEPRSSRQCHPVARPGWLAGCPFAGPPSPPFTPPRTPSLSPALARRSGWAAA